MTRAKFNSVFDAFVASKVRGSARLRSWMRQRWPAHLVRTKIDFDLILDLDPDNYIDQFCIHSGFYEREIVTALQSRCRPQDTLWDIGANIGLISLAMKKTNPSIRVIAFECSPLTVFRLTKNVALNGLNIQVANLALSSVNGVAEFHVQNSSNNGLSSLVPSSRSKLQDKISTSTLTSATVIDSGSVAIPNLIKIDVEGHEAEVFKGFGPHLSDKNLHTIVFEANDIATQNEITELLGSFGFKCSPIEPVATEVPTNFIAVR